MSEIKRSIIQSLWGELSDSAFDIKQFSEDFIADCGEDADNLKASDIEKLYHDTLDDRWSDIAFTFNEVLAYYLVFDNLSDEQFVRAVFASLSLSDAIQRDYGDWEFSFDKIFDLICRNKDKSDFVFRMNFFRELLKD